jgi:nod factor export ATP-binding protein I
MQEAQDFCHRVLILDRGTLLCENTPQGLIADLKAQNLEEVFVRLTSQDMAYE